MLEFHYPNLEVPEEPHADLVINENQTLDLSWHNTILYTHRARFAEVDHVFFAQQKRVASMAGLWIFRQALPNFDELAMDLLAHDYTQIHKPEPSSGDIDKWVEFNVEDLEKA